MSERSSKGDEGTAAARADRRADRPLAAYADVLRLIAAVGRSGGVERVALAEARGRVLASDLVAREDLPPFDNTAVDGFAVRAADTAGATSDAPVRLVVGGTVFAGAPLPERDTAAAAAVRIMTGAPLPAGFDTAIRVEDAVLERDSAVERLVLSAPVVRGAHVRYRGEDVRAGTLLVAAPRVLTPSVLAVAAGQGIAEVEAVVRPVLRVAATGDELVEDPRQALAPGQIRNTSLPFLLGEAERLGLPAIREGVMPDREDDAVERVGRWLAERRGAAGSGGPPAPLVVVSTGAVSVGDKDFVPATVRRCGFEVLAHGIAVRPGKPVLLARHAATVTFWVGLPGNVLSTAAGFRFFVMPLLRALCGLDPAPTRRRARLAADFVKPAGLRFFARGALRTSDDAVLEFVPEDRQASGMLSALAVSNAYAMVPEPPSRLPAGSIVDVVGDDEGL